MSNKMYFDLISKEIVTLNENANKYNKYENHLAVHSYIVRVSYLRQLNCLMEIPPNAITKFKKLYGIEEK